MITLAFGDAIVNSETDRKSLANSIDIEIMSIETLKPEIRKDIGEAQTGIVIKKTTRYSPATFSYEFVGSSSAFVEKIESMASRIDTKALAEGVRKHLLKE